MMSGTSVDSIDVALCETGGPAEGAVGDGRLTCRLLAFHEHPIDDGLRARIHRAFSDPAGGVSLVCSLGFEIGAAFGDAARAAMDAAGVSPGSIDAIASHGQTLFHVSPGAFGDAVTAAGTGSGRAGEAVAPSTLQVGEPSVIASRSGVAVVVSDFRGADMAVGGQGAPLVPFGDWCLFSRPGRGIGVLNLGGIANITYLPPDGGLDGVTAFDTGPACMVMDSLVSRHFPNSRGYDDGGKLAATGTVDAALLARMMDHPYIEAMPPKSTGREAFGAEFVDWMAGAAAPEASHRDLIATATEFTARTVACNLARFVATRGPLDDLLVAGGGARNPHLLTRLRAAMAAEGLASTPVRALDETGISAKARECIAFALLGHARLAGLPGNVPSATGASRRVMLGRVTRLDPASGGGSKSRTGDSR